jgi:formate hydrogenlyase transcriptional activator
VAVDNALHAGSAQSAQQQLRYERDRMRLLLEVNNAVVSHLDLDELFTAVSACLRRVIQHDGSSLLLCDEANGVFACWTFPPTKVSLSKDMWDR